MTTPAPEPVEPPPIPPEQAIVTVQTGLAETPFGQRVAVMITALLPKDQAQLIAKSITDITGAMSGSGLIVAAPGMNGTAQGTGVT